MILPRKQQQDFPIFKTGRKIDLKNLKQKH